LNGLRVCFHLNKVVIHIHTVNPCVSLENGEFVKWNHQGIGF